jgi:hypothetical protein
MTPILEKIVAHKRLEVLSSEQAISSQQLKDSMYYHRETVFSKKRFAGQVGSLQNTNASRPQRKV